jgi:hypothetical protein
LALLRGRKAAILTVITFTIWIDADHPVQMNCTLSSFILMARLIS